jgi:hypothetical protein
MVATVPIKLLNRFPINEFRFASRSEPLTTVGDSWSDIKDLILNFDENDKGTFLVTLTIPGTGNQGSVSVQETDFQVVRRTGPGQDTPLGQGSWVSTDINQVFPFSLVCEAEVSPNKNGSAIVAQWKTTAGTAHLGGMCSLTAVGSMVPSKVAFTDENHFEYPELFSRGLRLANYSEVLFLTGYSATAAIRPLKFKGIENVVLDAAGQMQWIVDHLDEFFKTIPYGDGSGVYSKKDIVYFDLVIDKTVSAKAQTAVLKVLEKWFEDVDPKPSTGILKKIQALAFASTKVEIEFILAH